MTDNLNFSRKYWKTCLNTCDNCPRFN